MSKVMRSVKNVTKGYSSVQVKVRNGEIYSCAWIKPRSNELTDWDSYEQRSMGPNRDGDAGNLPDDIQLVWSPRFEHAPFAITAADMMQINRVLRNHVHDR